MRLRQSSSSSMDTKVIHAEWIGKHAKIITAGNQSLVGLEGRVVDETRNMVVIETQRGVKRVPKRGTVFAIDGEEVAGDEALAAPGERIKW